jgi:hypothetical protein
MAVASRSHQTVRLTAGRHTGPDAGACVMELASMLAGEPFSDHPRSVCPAIATFLRHYNDRVDTDRRQDLYEIAALVVGTAGGRRLARRRRRACAEALDADRGTRRLRLRWPGLVAMACAEDFIQRGAHREALAFVRRLAEIGASDIPTGKLRRSANVPGREAPLVPIGLELGEPGAHRRQ